MFLTEVSCEVGWQKLSPQFSSSPKVSKWRLSSSLLNNIQWLIASVWEFLVMHIPVVPICFTGTGPLQLLPFMQVVDHPEVEKIARCCRDRTRQLQVIPKWPYHRCIEKCKDWWNKCIKFGQSYFEQCTVKHTVTNDCQTKKFVLTLLLEVCHSVVQLLLNWEF